MAALDAAHEDLSGPAVRHICQREFEVFGNAEYERLAGISASHIYNLRRSAAYRKVRLRVEHTRARQVSIGERAPTGSQRSARISARRYGASRPPGRPTGAVSHQCRGHRHPVANRGLYRDLSERHLKPVLEAMLHQFPFRILGFHCDNGSEFLNHTVAKLLNKLLVESSPNHGLTGAPTTRWWRGRTER